MIDEFSQYAIKLSVAKICQNIGWTSVTNTSLDILEDLLQVYMTSIARLSHNYAELFGQCEPTINHLALAFKDMGISVSELEDYVSNVDSSVVLEVPKYPIPKESHLNLLKPGSREVVTRPVHIHEHLPPMHPHLENDEYDLKQSPLSVDVTTSDGVSPLSSPQNIFKRPDEPSTSDARKIKTEEEIRPLREISSVMMTTSGFLSHAREGKLPEARTQPFIEFDEEEPEEECIEEEIKPIVPQISNEPPSKPEKKKKSKHGNNIEEDKKVNIEPVINEEDLKEDSNDDEFSRLMKQIAQLKHLRPAMTSKMPSSPHPNKHKSHKHSARRKDSEHKSKSRLSKGDKRSGSPSVRESFKESSQFESGVIKLQSEPDKHKLNIFKKISKVKEEIDDVKEISVQIRPDENFEDGQGHKNVDSSKEKISFPPASLDPEATLSPTGSPIPFNDELETPRTPRTPDVPKSIEHKKRKKDKHKEKKEIIEVIDRFQDFSPKSKYIEENLGKPKTPEVIPREEENNQPINFFNNYPPGSASAGLIPPWNPSLISYLYSSSPGVPPAPVVPSTPSSSKEVVPPIPLLIQPPSSNTSTPTKETTTSISNSNNNKSGGVEEIKKKSRKEIKKLKIKKKKDKKEKNKIKDKSEKKKLKLEKKQKEKLKKVKKEKKKEKVMLDKVDSPGGSVPKITLKLSPDDSVTEIGSRKIIIKQIDKKDNSILKEEQKTVEIPSRTVADVSVSTHHSKGHKSGKNKGEGKSSKTHSLGILTIPSNIVGIPPPFPLTKPTTPAAAVVAAAAAAVVPKPIGVTDPIKSINIPEPNKIWICPACNHPDDGSPMIACDICDQWFHYLCVGILVAPESDWYCTACIMKREETGERKKKRRKKC